MYIKQKRKIIIIIVLLLVSALGIFALLSNKNNSVEVKADQTISNKNEVNEEADISKKNNVAYLKLKDDPNADDASVAIPNIMYPGVEYQFNGQKTAYLTFDDGPSEHVTGEVLDILKNNDIKATFFTVGKIIESNPKAPDLLKRMAKEGHAIASHGYSHDYSILYPNGVVNVENFMNDMDKNNKILKGILGEDFSTRVIRLPGGHASWKGMESLDSRLKNEGIYQTDWNALNGDAEGDNIPADKMLERLKQSAGDKRSLIILMHDTDAKKTTVEYLQGAIDYLKSQGYIFKTLK